MIISALMAFFPVNCFQQRANLRPRSRFRRVVYSSLVASSCISRQSGFLSYMHCRVFCMLDIVLSSRRVSANKICTLLSTSAVVSPASLWGLCLEVAWAARRISTQLLRLRWSSLSDRFLVESFFIPKTRRCLSRGSFKCFTWKQEFEGPQCSLWKIHQFSGLSCWTSIFHRFHLPCRWNGCRRHS